MKSFIISRRRGPFSHEILPFPFSFNDSECFNEENEIETSCRGANFTTTAFSAFPDTFLFFSKLTVKAKTHDCLFNKELPKNPEGSSNIYDSKTGEIPAKTFQPILLKQVKKEDLNVKTIPIEVLNSSTLDNEFFECRILKNGMIYFWGNKSLFFIRGKSETLT